MFTSPTMTSEYRSDDAPIDGRSQSLMYPASHGPIPWPMSVCKRSRSEVATDRIRNVAIACVIANDGPKNTAAMNCIAPNVGRTIDMSPERYAANWNGTHSNVAMPGTHRYQRRSLRLRLIRSARKPPANVPTPPTMEKNEIQ